MQDKYVGDIGDFGKYALLSFIQKKTDLSLGIIWYLVNPDHTDREHQANDGKHISYLGINGKPDKKLQDMEPVLFDRLRSIVEEKRRKVQFIMDDKILGLNATFFDALVSISPANKGVRNDWVKHAIKAVEGKEVIFLDPDNGLANGETCSGCKLDAKYVFRSELDEFWGDGRRVVVLYHHPNRSEKNVDHDMQIDNLVKSLEERPALKKAKVLPLRYRRGTSRVYFVIVPRNKAAHWKNWLYEFAEKWPARKIKGKLIRAFECKFPP